MSISQVADIVGINRRTLNFRINDCGMDLREAMFAPKFANQTAKIAWENDPDKKIVSKPISFLPFTLRDKKQELLDLYKPDKEKIDKFMSNAPIAEEYWKDLAETNDKK